MTIIYAVSCKLLEFAVGGKWQDKEQTQLKFIYKLIDQIRNSDKLSGGTLKNKNKMNYKRVRTKLQI